MSRTPHLSETLPSTRVTTHPLPQALELTPHDVRLLEARAGACAKLHKHAACLHDGELIVRLMPDWHRG